MKKGWRGYNFSRAIDGQMIPQRVQNLVIRDYCQRQGIDYLLSATEYSMENATMILHTIYDELPNIEGIVFYSVNLLPRSPGERNRLYQTVLKNGCAIRFALEELVLAREKDVTPIEELMLCKELMPTVGYEPEQS